MIAYARSNTIDTTTTTWLPNETTATTWPDSSGRNSATDGCQDRAAADDEESGGTQPRTPPPIDERASRIPKKAARRPRWWWPLSRGRPRGVARCGAPG